MKNEVSLDDGLSPVFNDGRALSEGLSDFFSKKENHNLLKPSTNLTGAGSLPGGVLAEGSQNTLEDAKNRAQKSCLAQDIVAYQKLKRNCNSA